MNEIPPVGSTVRVWNSDRTAVLDGPVTRHLSERGLFYLNVVTANGDAARAADYPPDHIAAAAQICEHAAAPAPQ